MNTSVMFSSKTDMWATPKDFFNKVNKEFNLQLDVCATDSNHKCSRYFTEKQDGLAQEWDADFWMNPPYGRTIGLWVKKAYEQSKKHGVVGVLLLPSRTDTKWFHEYVLGKAEVRFIKGRLKFGDATNSAPFPSILVVYK